MHSIRNGPFTVLYRVPAERYPYIPTQGDHGADMTWSSPAVERYGRDGRRRLVSAACFRDETTWELSESDAADPRCRALSSRDVLLCVLSFLDRCVVPPKVAIAVCLRQSTYLVSCMPCPAMDMDTSKRVFSSIGQNCWTR